MYCPAGDFYIDPWAAVDRAIVTHAHSDHARSGSLAYLAAESSGPLLRLRLGNAIPLQTLSYGQRIRLGRAIVSLHPAGHILGSSQVRIEVDGVVAVVSGDYKRQSDRTCANCEPVPCDLFVTESTFGLPVFRWKPTKTVVDEILAWWSANQSERRPSLLLAYAVGKSQRLISEICSAAGRDASKDMFVHGALLGPNAAYRESGVDLPELPSVASMPRNHDWSRSLLLAPPSAHNSAWMDRFRGVSVGMASGWMGIRGTRRRRAIDRGFVLSDHCDWRDLLSSIEECKPREVWVTHGFTGVLSRYQSEQGRESKVIETRFSGEEDGNVLDEPSNEESTP
jgi:putative mRNA 3-end processing factor